VKKIKIITIIILGLLLSIALHELFHYLLHVNHIVGVEFFTHNNIVSMHILTPKGYNILLEELVAYLITVITMIGTVFVVNKVT